MRKRDSDELQMILGSLFPEYQPISEAPTYVEPEHVEDERRRRYKAIDRYGNIYLMVNPAVWRERASDMYPTQRAKIKPRSELLLSAGEVATELRRADNRRNVGDQGSGYQEDLFV